MTTVLVVINLNAVMEPPHAMIRIQLSI